MKWIGCVGRWTRRRAQSKTREQSGNQLEGSRGLISQRLGEADHIALMWSLRW